MGPRVLGVLIQTAKRGWPMNKAMDLVNALSGLQQAKVIGDVQIRVAQ